MKKIFCLLFVLMLSLNFSACGGGGGGGSDSNTPTTVSGTASEGLLITGKTVNLKDANGKSAVGTTNAVTGIYSIDITGLTAPFLVTVTGTHGTYVSLAKAAGTANINPITTMVVALAAGNPNVSALFTNLKTAELTAINTNYTAKTALVTASLLPVLSGYKAEDYFTRAITPGTGIDALFDKYLIAIDPTAGITVKTKDASATTVLTIPAATVTANKTDPLPIISVVSFLHYTLPDQYNFLTNYPGKTVADEPAILFSAYTLTTGIDYGGGTLVSGYALNQFVDKDTVNAATPDPDGVLGTNDARQLYSVVVRSNQDGFSNRTKFYDNGSKAEVYNADLRWDQFTKGYLLDLNYTGKTYFEATLTGEFMKMFNTKYAYDIYMFRKIDVKRPDAAGSLATFEVGATTDSYVDDTNYTASNGGLTTTKFTITTISFGAYTNVKAISLDQFLSDYVTDIPGSYTYKIVALDGTFKEGWTYANMHQAYYLPDFDFIVQVTGGSQVAGTKINFPVRIELIGAAYEYVYTAKNPPAYAKAYNEK
ncbi:MAG: hypothetical protein ABFD82_06600 [Syntrophaceae bacterium]